MNVMSEARLVSAKLKRKPLKLGIDCQVATLLTIEPLLSGLIDFTLCDVRVEIASKSIAISYNDLLC